MTFVNKLSKSFRWLRCSTLCAILFYMFFIGLILHSTSHKLQLHQQQQQKEQAVVQATATDSPSSSSSVKALPLELEQQQQQNLGDPQTKESEGKQKLQPIAANELQGGVGGGGNEGGTRQGSGKSKLQQPQPETVIITTSNVNEKQILAKAFKR